MFDGVKIISRYLETRYLVNPDLISEDTLTELLKLFTKNDNITVAELYAQVSKLYKEDNNFFSNKLKTEAENLSDNLVNDDSNTYKYCGKYGEVTWNKLGVALKEKIQTLN